MYASGNQPAFPRPGDFNPQIGMTLRDYFAAKAMCGYLTGDALLEQSDTAAEWIEKTAKASYEMADAMIQARGESK